MLQQVILDVVSLIAPYCNRSSDVKFLMGHLGDGARWDRARRATGRTGDGGAAGHDDATWHGGVAGEGDATWHCGTVGDGNPTWHGGDEPPRVDAGASLFSDAGARLFYCIG
jgi:hypothetical protein